MDSKRATSTYAEAAQGRRRSPYSNTPTNENKPSSNQPPPSQPEAFEWSDDEINENGRGETVLEAALKRTLPFGRYKSIQLGELIKTREQRDYLRRLATWDKLYFDLQRDITVALKHYINVSAEVERRNRTHPTLAPPALTREQF